MMVLMGMIMPATAPMIVIMVIVAMGMMVMGMVIMMRMIMAMMMMAMPTLIISTALGLEWPFHGVHSASQTAQHFDQHMIIFNVDRICRHFGRRVTITDMPSRLHQSRGVFCTNFDKLLRRSLHKHETAIF